MPQTDDPVALGAKVDGLSREDLHVLESILDRLGSAFAEATACLRGNIDGPRGLARAIGADVAVCYRVLAGMKTNGGASRGRLSERLMQWPGASGAELVAERLLRSLGRTKKPDPLTAAVRDYVEAIHNLAGTHARLVRLVRSAEASLEGGLIESSGRLLAARRLIARGSADMLGYSVGVETAISVIRPIPGSPELLEGCRAIGLLGVECQRPGVCITTVQAQSRVTSGEVAQEVRFTPLGRSLQGCDGVLDEFCTRPLPLTASESADGMLRHFIDPAASRHKHIDIVLAKHWQPASNPQYEPTPVWSEVCRVKHPIKVLVLDVYMHRSLLSGALPAIGAYLWHPTLDIDPRAEQQDRLPGSPRIELLSQSPTPPPTDAWAHQTALTTRLFELAGWDRSEYIGFRCQEQFPAWGAAYFMTFDLAPAPHGKPRGN